MKLRNLDVSTRSTRNQLQNMLLDGMNHKPSMALHVLYFVPEYYSVLLTVIPFLSGLSCVISKQSEIGLS